MEKECVYVIMLKIALVLVKNVFFGLKKSISGWVHQVAAKSTASNVLNDIAKAYKDAGEDLRTLPKILKSVGGETDFMIGIK